MSKIANAITCSLSAHSNLLVALEFTRDVGALERSIDDAAGLGSEVDVLSMDALLRDAANYFGRHADADETEGGCYRLLLVLQQNDTVGDFLWPGLFCTGYIDMWCMQAPAVDTNRIGLAESFFSNERASLDVVYWHQHMPTTKAQATFDQICSFDSDNPLSNFYFLEVGDSLERLHQVSTTQPTSRFSSTFVPFINSLTRSLPWNRFSC